MSSYSSTVSNSYSLYYLCPISACTHTINRPNTLNTGCLFVFPDCPLRVYFGCFPSALHAVEFDLHKPMAISRISRHLLFASFGNFWVENHFSHSNGRIMKCGTSICADVCCDCSRTTMRLYPLYRDFRSPVDPGFFVRPSVILAIRRLFVWQ